MDEIFQLCSAYNVPVIEDAAERLGATYNSKQTWTCGEYAELSLVVLKNRTSDENTGIRSGGSKAA